MKKNKVEKVLEELETIKILLPEWAKLETKKETIELYGECIRVLLIDELHHGVVLNFCVPLKNYVRALNRARAIVMLLRTCTINKLI